MSNDSLTDTRSASLLAACNAYLAETGTWPNERALQAAIEAALGSQTPQNENLPAAQVSESASAETMPATIIDELKLIRYDLGALIAAKNEKDANGESERYQELKRNAWGNARAALVHLDRIIEAAEALKG